MTPAEWNAKSDDDKMMIRGSLSDLGRAACDYCDAGFTVTPLRPKSKEAMMEGGFKNNFDYWEDAALWWLDNPSCNVGIVTGTASGLLVVDVDSDREKNKYGDESIADWEGDNGELPETATEQTPSGGEHRYFSVSTEFPTMQNSIVDIDMKGDGGYVVAPPSVHPNGGTYFWDLSIEDYPIADADEGVVRLYEYVKATRRQAEAAGIFNFPDVVHDGEGREANLITLAFSLRARGKEHDEILEELRKTNNERVVPPKPDKDLRRMAKSACRKPAGLSPEYQAAKNAAEADRLMQAERKAAELDALISSETEGGEREIDPEVQQKLTDVAMGVTPPILHLSDLIGEPVPELRQAIIDGVLRENCKMLVQGASKAGKTWAMIELSVAMATGGAWMGLGCRKGRVLYVNFELQSESWLNRLAKVCDGMGVRMDDAMPNIDLWNLRGFSASMEEMNREQFFPKIRRGEYQMIILDPFYKLMEGSENDAEVVGDFVRNLEKLCVTKDVAVCYVHHYSKGAKGDVSPMDRSSGSGVFARDADALIDMAELDTEGSPDYAGTACLRVSFVLRDFPPIDQMDVFFEDYHHFLDTECALEGFKVASAASNGGKKSGKMKQAKASDAASDLCEWMVGELAHTGVPISLRAVSKMRGLEQRTVKKYLATDSRFEVYQNTEMKNALYVCLEGM